MLNTEYVANGLGNQRRIDHRTQIDEPGAFGESGPQFGRQPQGESCLTDAAGPDQCYRREVDNNPSPVSVAG